MFRHLISIGTLSLATLFYAGQACAAPPKISGGTVTANPDGSINNITLTVKGPNGFWVSDFSKDGAPSVSIFEKGKITDGVYSWTVTGMTKNRIINPKRKFNNGRGKEEREFAQVPSRETGVFQVTDGTVVKVDPDVKEPDTPKPKER